MIDLLCYAACFFASDEASFITRQWLAVDGGDDIKLVELALD
ncbi:hypothetical protein ACFLUC_02335 [Chloroflexota bacterium]